MHPVGDGARMRFDRAFVESMVALAPAEFTLHARNPAHSVKIGGNGMVFSPVCSAPNAQDLMAVVAKAMCMTTRISSVWGQSLNCIHVFGGYPVEPADRDVKTRHLDSIADFIKLSDKPSTRTHLDISGLLMVLNLHGSTAASVMSSLLMKPA